MLSIKLICQLIQYFVCININRNINHFSYLINNHENFQYMKKKLRIKDKL